MATAGSLQESEGYMRTASCTLIYTSICFTCIVWQVFQAGKLVYRSHKMIHCVVLTETLIALIAILFSLLTPLIDLGCEIIAWIKRFWVSIIGVDLGGCCVQSILLYKAYICHNRSKWLLLLGSFIILGYIALTALYATLGKVPTYKDMMGNCILNNFQWPALAKLGLDIASNVMLSMAFLIIIHRHYRVFNNTMYKSLFSSGLIFSVGVIVTNITIAILIAVKAVGGLSSNLYSFDWVIVGYLLIKQFKMEKESTERRTLVSVQSTATLQSTFTMPPLDEEAVPKNHDKPVHFSSSSNADMSDSGNSHATFQQNSFKV